MTGVPRLVVSAPASGHGKTAVAVGLLAAYTARGLTTAGFKVGPDYADTAYLGLAAGRSGRNLDPRLVGESRIAPLFAHGATGAQIAVVEGTMGLFDSVGGRTETDSTAAVAADLRAPVVLVIDVAAMGQSVAALVHGFRAYDEVLRIGGVIFTRVASDRHEHLLREALDDIAVPVFGALRRRDLPSALPSGQQGVVPVVQRTVEAVRGVRRLAEAIADGVDLDGLLALARSAPPLPIEPWSAEMAVRRSGQDRPADDDVTPVSVIPGRAGSGERAGPGGARGRPVVALAGGPGGYFGYAETAELLLAAGASVHRIDPLRDESLPDDLGALVLPGGLPEAYAEDLSANRRLSAAVAAFAHRGGPVLAEGTGLLWLTREFDGRPMCGVLDATGISTERMVVGYREATARASTAVAERGARRVGYKQHCGIVRPRAGQTPAWTWGSGTPEGFVWRRVHASQLTLHWAGAPEIATRLVAAARAERPGRWAPEDPADRSEASA
ncbi:MAG TPA: cobyrinate a,c-diamide synthase [Micromonosporaceae bacterium]|nr:cobyrinate a,c-diamide synthase [Micromonosporaceae bacterium]